MIKKFFIWRNPKYSLQYWLSFIAAIFLFLHALIFTLSPAVKFRSWDVNYQWSHWSAFLIWIIAFFYLNKLSIQFLKNHDQFIIPIIGLLTGWGIQTIWRLYPIFGLRQAIWFLLSVILANFFFKKTFFLFTLRKYKYILLIFGLVLATLTFFFGTYPGGIGPRLWLGASGLYFQPSQLLKLLLIIYLSAYFSEKDYPNIRIIQSVFPTIILVLSSLFILIGQRDMGTALIFIVIYILMIFIAFGKKRIILIGLGIIVASALIGYFFIDLIRIRFLAWVLPWLDPQAGSYQIIQSIIAIAAGGLFGSGIGLGSPNTIPISHSDFIFSALMEETGLLGGIGILLLLGLLLSRGLIISINASNKFYRFLAAGISTYILSQALLIIGGNIRLLPITGVTLPFVSYGGSSLIVSIVCIFILLIISNNQQRSIPVNLNDQPYTIIGILFSISLVMVAMVTGWWAIFRSYDLQHRIDNTRRLTSTLYVKRGSILDRNNNRITESSGDVGNLKRTYFHPPLTNTVGYFHNRFGLFGLESVFDEYLSGEKGYAASFLWFNYLLYDQPPPGVDIRLTIDLNIQKKLDEIFIDEKGSAVIINPKNGEILAIASHPHIDANNLETFWEEWQIDENAPFLNRAVQGAYPIGEIITPFLFTEDILHLFEARDFPIGRSFSYQGRLYSCAIEDPANTKWDLAISNGCPSVLLQFPVGRKLDIFYEAINKHNLVNTPDIGLPIRPNPPVETSGNWNNLLFGENPIRVNPLQIALSASIFSNYGFQPEINILYAVNTAQGGWIILSDSEQKMIISRDQSLAISNHLFSSEINGWEISARGSDKEKVNSWYIAGTPSDWEGNPLVIAIVMEKDDPASVRQAGRDLFSSSIR